MRRTGPTPQDRHTVLLRASYRCERCELPLNSNLSVHHRRPRRMGGTRRPDANSPQNLLVLCGSGTTGCHGWIESHRREAYDAGYLLYDMDDPLIHPYRDGSGNWWILTEDGGRIPHKPATPPPVGIG